MALRAFRGTDRPQGGRGPDIPQRSGLLLGLALPLPLRRGPRLPRRGLRRSPALPAVARVARLRGLRAVGRARPHAHAGAADRPPFPRGGAPRGRGPGSLPGFPTLARFHVSETHAELSPLAPI